MRGVGYAAGAAHGFWQPAVPESAHDVVESNQLSELMINVRRPG